MKTKLLFSIFTAAIASIALTSHANTYTVTTTNDTGPNSLRAVITTANGATGPHTISFGTTGNFAGGGTINLLSPLPVISNSVTITGWSKGGSTNAISIKGSPLVFAAGTSNSLQQLNIGGYITNGQSLTISGCVITNGGILSTGILQVASSSVIGSPTAGIWNSGNATLNIVTVSSCSQGGIHNEGAMAIANSLITNNYIANAGGAGIYSQNTLQVTGCQIVDNLGDGNGSGILNVGYASVLDSTIEGNYTWFGFGGGIYSQGTLYVARVLLNQNIASKHVGMGGCGGGVCVNGGQASFTNTTFCGNMAQGESLPGLGSAVYGLSGSVEMVNCTIVRNEARTDPYGGSTPQRGDAAFYNYNASVTLLNTIIATNFCDSGDPPDVCGAFVSQGYNFIGNSSGSSGWNAVTDYQNAPPLLLGPLQDNGGPTLTCALLPGSLCILAGTSTGAPVTDQRGVFRPYNQCDIGAYQYTTLLVPVITWTNPVPIVYGTALSVTQLNASSSIGGSFAYTPPAGTVLNAGSSQVLMAVFSPADPNTAAGATNTVLLTVQPANQTITFPGIPTQSVNAGPITLAATASSGLPVTYSLDSGPALLAGNLLSVTGTPGQVTVRASQSGNMNYNAAADVVQSFLVVTNSMPLITSQPTNLMVNLGSDAAFSVSATTLPLNYQWYFNGFSLTGATNATLLLPRTTTNVAGPYKAILSNPVGSVTSVVAVLTVLAPTGVPQITSQPQSKTIRAGESASFTVGATGNATLYYQWYLGASPNTNGLILGATGTAYSTLAISTNTSYWVSVHNSLGLVDSAPAFVTVLPAQTPKLSLQILAGYPVIGLDGKVGTNYVIQYKNSLTDSNWTLLLNFTLSADPLTLFDTSATGVPRRYYRAYAY
jgi:hypothetical protein